MEVLRVLVVELGADKDAKNAVGSTPLHWAAVNGQMEAIKALEQLGAQIDVQAANGDTPLKLSIRLGHHQAAQVLRELERAARARKEAATSERAQQATEKAEAQSKVRGVELAPVRGVSDAVSLAHGWVASSEVPAAGFLWRR
jgi:ankyrin repeat protein